MVRSLSEEIVVVDIETTGLEPEYSSIVELGFCMLNTTTGKITKLWDIVCREKNRYINKNAWCFENSSLTYEDVKNAGLLEDCKEEIQGILDLAPVAAYNKDFDFGFLRSRGFIIAKEIRDPMLILTPIMKLPHEYYDYKWPSMEEAYHYFFPDNGFTHQHRAVVDAYYEAKIIWELIKLKRSERA